MRLNTIDACETFYINEYVIANNKFDHIQNSILI